MVIKSKKQKMNQKVFYILFEWLENILPENEISEAEKLSMIPTEKYYTSMGQRRLNAYTYRWVRKKIKKLLKRNYKLESITLRDVENA